MLGFQFPTPMLFSFPDLIIENGQIYVMQAGSQNRFRNVWIKAGGVLRLSDTNLVLLTAIKCSSFRNDGGVNGVFASEAGSFSGTYFNQPISLTRSQQSGGNGGAGTGAPPYFAGGLQSNGNGGRGSSFQGQGVGGGAGGSRGLHGQSLYIDCNSFINTGGINLSGSNGSGGANGSAPGSGVVYGGGGGGAGGNSGNLYIKSPSQTATFPPVLSGGTGGGGGVAPPLNTSFPENQQYFGAGGSAGIAGTQVNL